MEDDSDGVEVAPSVRVWLAAQEPVDRLLRDINPTWRAELRSMLSDSPYDVVRLELTEHEDQSVLMVDLDVDVRPLPRDVQLFGTQIVETIWPDPTIVLRPIDPFNAVGPGTKIYRCCGGLGSHIPPCKG